MNPTLTAPRGVQRVRHELKARRLVVRAVQRPTPNFVSVTFEGEDLRDFVSASFDDHLKFLVPPAPGAAPALPAFGTGARDLSPGAPRPLMRDYTPRRFDAVRRELQIEFALHGDGPAAAWAAAAQPGHPAAIAGPRGSFLVPLDYDWHLLVGDETALPAIARRLEELPAGARAIVRAQTEDAADRRIFSSAADVDVQWLDAGTAGALEDAVRALKLPAGEGYAWAAGEGGAMARVRDVLFQQHRLDKAHVRAAAYWKRGVADHHEDL